MNQIDQIQLNLIEIILIIQIKNEYDWSNAVEFNWF